MLLTFLRVGLVLWLLVAHHGYGAVVRLRCVRGVRGMRPARARSVILSAPPPTARAQRHCILVIMPNT
ncbi:unnamed protein product [Arctia plantaginis]|uniref:Secreted protein n=1 Tax=Arctia plantaginis TaxID=874455 RepID=A0A8S1BD55_ARCPL|nr:unnamed protein product [Arctia plantaginis]